MPTYETLFITLPTLTDEQEQAVVETAAGIVTDGGGDFTVNERMGRRRLAYPIRKYEEGVYTRFLYDAESAVPLELERRFRISDDVLRYLTVKLERDWAVAAKEEAVRVAAQRVEEAARAAEEAARLEAEAAAKADAEANADPEASADTEAPAADENTSTESAEPSSDSKD